MSDSQRNSLDATRENLRRFLDGPEGATAAGIAAGMGLTVEEVRAALDVIGQYRPVPERWASHWRAVGEGAPLFGRWMLAQVALRSLEKIPGLPLVDEVRQLMYKDYQLIAQPGAGRDALFVPGGRVFREFAALAGLRRFAAGQVHWGVAGVPRSWLLKMSLRDATRTLVAAGRMGGWSPCFEAHISNRGMLCLIEREYRRSYIRMARSMELQPGVRGLIGISWLHSDETMRVSPHLVWINRLVLDNGGILVHLDSAAADSGFLVGSQQRKEWFESGVYRPRNAMFIWPRAAFLDWARRQGE